MLNMFIHSKWKTVLIFPSLLMMLHTSFNHLSFRHLCLFMKSFVVNLAVTCSMFFIILLILLQAFFQFTQILLELEYLDLCSCVLPLAVASSVSSGRSMRIGQVLKFLLSPNLQQSMAKKFSGCGVVFLCLTTVNNTRIEFLTHKIYFVSLLTNFFIFPLLRVYL